MENVRTERPIHMVAGGAIAVWVDMAGTIHLKSQDAFHDPVELAEHEALELAALLVGLVDEQHR